MMENIKKGLEPLEAIEKASGQYGRFDEAVKKLTQERSNKRWHYLKVMKEELTK